MNNKFSHNFNKMQIDDFIKIYNNNNFSLNIVKKNSNNNYLLIIEIMPLDCSKSEAIKKNKIILNIIKYDGTHIPTSKLNKYLIRNLKKCKKEKMSNNLAEKLYLQFRFPNIYKKYFKFDETIIVLIVIIALFIFGVIWSSYHNIITDYMLTH